MAGGQPRLFRCVTSVRLAGGGLEEGHGDNHISVLELEDVLLAKTPAEKPE